MLKSRLKTNPYAVFAFALGVVYFGNASAANIDVACKNLDGKTFFTEIAKDDVLFKKYTPKIIRFGTLDANSGAVYEVKNDSDNFKFNFKPYDDGTWIEKGSEHDLKPVYAQININQDQENNIIIRWQRGVAETQSGSNKPEIAYTFGDIKEMTFMRDKNNKCWELYSVLNVQE